VLDEYTHTHTHTHTHTTLVTIRHVNIQICVHCAQEIWIRLRQLSINTYQGSNIPSSAHVGRHFATAVVLSPIWTGACNLRLKATENKTRKTAMSIPILNTSLVNVLRFKLTEMFP